MMSLINKLLNIDNTDEIIHRLDSFITAGNVLYSSWFIGITNNINRRFLLHNVSFKTDYYDFLIIRSEKTRNDVFNYFMEMGCQYKESKYKGKTIYLYFITKDTMQNAPGIY